MGHESFFLLAESHLVHAGNRLEETQCASLGSLPVRKYFPVSLTLACKELVMDGYLCSKSPVETLV